MSRILFIALLVLGNAQAAPAQHRSAHDQAFDAVYARFTEGYRRSDPAMVVSLYTPDAFYLQPGRKIERGLDVLNNAFGFLRAYRDRPAGPAIGFEILDRHVEGDIGWDIGYYKLNADGRPITAQTEPDGKFIVLWKRGPDGQWRIYADGYSGVGEPPKSDGQLAAEAGVKRAVDAYFKGVTYNDSTQLDLAFHPDAQLSATLPNGQVYRAPYSEWRKFTRAPSPDAAGRNNRIANIEIMGNAAVVTTVLDWPRVRYVDYLSLIKAGADEWKIVSKIWHQEAKPAPGN